MPTLFRFVVVVGVLGSLVFGLVFALATMVEPEQKPISVTIPASRLTGK